MSVKIHGLEALHQQLLELNAQLAAKALARAARRAFAPVLATAKSMVPRDSGELADSLKLSVVKAGSGDTVVRVGIRIGKGRGASQARLAAAAFGESQSKRVPAARRWHFIELGTSHSAAHPFLRPALDSNAAQVLELLKVELRKAIAQAVKK